MLQDLLQPPGNHQIMDEAAMPLAAPSSKEYASCVSTKQLFKTLYSNTGTLAASGQHLIYSKHTGQFSDSYSGISVSKNVGSDRPSS